jgi:4'-phosphopantetheinyl transferase EntD
MGVLRELFCGFPVVTREGDPRALGPLADVLPEEREAVARAVPKRQHEFWATRHLARLALAELGFAPGPILNHPDRSPRWPAGVLGSISHTEGWCGVALTTTDGQLRGLGIDAERINPMSEGVIERVLTTNEQTVVAGHSDVSTQAVLRFSAKEAIYKAIYPQVRHFVGFLEVEVAVHANGAFEATFVSPALASELDATRLSGRYRIAAGLCFAAVVLQ